MGMNTAALSFSDPGFELMRGVEAGDDQAVQRLFSTYRKRVFSYLYGSLRNREDALDLTQEVMIRICEKAGQYDERYPLTPWIFRVAANLRIDHSRRKNAQIHANSVAFDEAFNLSRVAKDTPEDRVARLDFCERFQNALKRLPPRQRKVAEMRLLQERRLREIAELEGISLGTVKSTLHSALGRLREALCDLHRCT